MSRCLDRCQERILAAVVFCTLMLLLLVLPGCVFVYVDGGAGSIAVDESELRYDIQPNVIPIPPGDPHDQADFSSDLDSGIYRGDKYSM